MKNFKNLVLRLLSEFTQNNIEYGFTISPDGRILEESSGNENSCSTDSRKVEPNSILMHGHPVPLPLSTGDIAILLATEAKTMEAVTVDGKYSRLTKKYPFNAEKSYTELYCELEKQLMVKAMDELGIDYKINKNDLIAMFKEYNGNQSLSDEDAVNEASKYGIDFKNASLEEIKNKVNKLMAFQIFQYPAKYDKIHNSIMENYNLIQKYMDTKEGIQTRHKFIEDIAAQYGLIYETDLFD